MRAPRPAGYLLPGHDAWLSGPDVQRGIWPVLHVSIRRCIRSPVSSGVFALSSPGHSNTVTHLFRAGPRRRLNMSRIQHSAIKCLASDLWHIQPCEWHPRHSHYPCAWPAGRSRHTAQASKHYKKQLFYWTFKLGLWSSPHAGRPRQFANL